MTEIKPNILGDLVEKFKKLNPAKKIGSVEKEIPTTGAVAEELAQVPRLPEGSFARNPQEDGLYLQLPNEPKLKHAHTFARDHAKHNPEIISDVNLGKVRKQTIQGIKPGEVIRLTYSTEGDKNLISSKKINYITGEETQIYPPPINADEPMGVVAQDISTMITPAGERLKELNGPKGELAQRLQDGDYNIVPLLPPTPEV